MPSEWPSRVATTPKKVPLDVARCVWVRQAAQFAPGLALFQTQQAFMKQQQTLAVLLYRQIVNKQEPDFARL